MKKCKYLVVNKIVHLASHTVSQKADYDSCLQAENKVWFQASDIVGEQGKEPIYIQIAEDFSG